MCWGVSNKGGTARSGTECVMSRTLCIAMTLEMGLVLVLVRNSRLVVVGGGLARANDAGGVT